MSQPILERGNKALWLTGPRHVTSFNQSECFISAHGTYAYSKKIDFISWFLFNLIFFLSLSVFFLHQMCLFHLLFRHFYAVNRTQRFFKKLLEAEFEPGFSGAGSNCPANCSTPNAVVYFISL